MENKTKDNIKLKATSRNEGWGQLNTVVDKKQEQAPGQMEKTKDNAELKQSRILQKHDSDDKTKNKTKNTWKRRPRTTSNWKLRRGLQECKSDDNWQMTTKK
jgi:hypothetical protein